MIRLAEPNDLEAIMEIVRLAIPEMRRTGNDQWKEDYPLSADFRKDIDHRELYVAEIDGRVAGFICINGLEPEEYQDAEWSVDATPLVLHRMAVSPAYARQGVGSRLMAFAEELALSQGITYLRSDTNSHNPNMNGLFQKFNYQFAGIIHFPGRVTDFNCYEKVLDPLRAKRA
jgi:GNAT superfamily N-acetyltransferase